ncbi:MAG: universal stress protein [Rhodothermales bacterium]|nr:universal stress protein [Rhodothermales bacterium]
MLQIRKILLATDLTRSASSAAKAAVRLANVTGSELHILFAEVLHGDVIRVPAGATTPNSISAQEYVLDQLHDELSTLEGAPVVVIERGVAPAPVLLDYAQTIDADLIVAGTHGRRGARHLVLGSVAEELVRLSDCPVLTVNFDGRLESDGELAVAVPVDFSEHSRFALSHGKALAFLLGARLEIIHVIEEPLHPAFYGPTLQSIYDVEPNLDEKVLEELKEFNRTTTGYPSDVTYTVVMGHPVHEILNFVEERKIDLLTMGTHGLTGIERFALGSVSERLVRRAPCPVFTVKSFGKQLTAARRIDTHEEIETHEAIEN